MESRATIHRKYRELAEGMSNGFVVKMDAWQEKESNYPIKADLYVEIQDFVINDAKSKGYNVVKGSILDLPLGAESVDTLIDTSTIDHVFMYETALLEYKRVLKDGGVLMLCVWLTDGPTHKSDRLDASGGEQWFFNKGSFISVVKVLFKVEEEYELLREGNNFVYYMRCKK